MDKSCVALKVRSEGSFVSWLSGVIWKHYSDVIMSAMASQITSVLIVNSTACSGADQRKHQSSASLVFVRGIHRWPNSPHKGPVTLRMLPFDDVIMNCEVMSYSQPNIPERSAPAAELKCDVDCDQSSRDHIDFFFTLWCKSIFNNHLWFRRRLACPTDISGSRGVLSIG